MGIKGLTTLIDDNLHLLQDHQLHHSKVIIDGNNLLHLLFYSYNVDFKHGGDYNKFYKKIKDFFAILKSCHIEPYIILDGGYDPDDRKFKTVLERATTRIHLSHFIGDDRNGKILPVLSYEVFICALNDLGVNHVTCDFEADNQIAVLANDFKCPVISFDSDFYILNVTHGFIPFDSVNFDVQPTISDDEGRQFKYLPVKIYFTQNFISCFPGLDKQVLPLMATVLGNDYVHISNFEEFYSALKVPKQLHSAITVSKTHTKFLKIMHWLGGLKSVEAGIDALVMSARPENKEKLKSLIEKSMKSYTDVASYTSFNLYEYFTVNPDTAQCVSHKSYNGNKLSNWFVNMHRQSKMAVFMQNTAVLHRNVFLCLVEDLKMPSSYNCSLYLRQILYSMILKEDLKDIKTEIEAANSKTCCVEEYDRQDGLKNLKKTLIPPISDLEGFGPIPGFGEIEFMKLDRKRLLISKALNVDFTNSDFDLFSDDVLYFMILIYWMRNANPSVDIFMVQSLVICWILLSLKTYGEEIEETQSQLNQAFASATSQQREKVWKNLEKFLLAPQHSRRHPFDVEIIHGFAQLQTCILTTTHLNQILQTPFSKVNPANVLNGCFLYNFYKDLQTRPRPDLFIAEMLVKQSPILNFFTKVMSVISSYVDLVSNKSESSESKKTKQRRKKKSSQTSTSSAHSDSIEKCEKSVEISSSIKKMKQTNAACELSNRFDFLEVDDSDDN